MLQDDKGAQYCLASNPKPRKLTKVQCQSLPGKNNLTFPVLCSAIKIL